MTDLENVVQRLRGLIGGRHPDDFLFVSHAGAPISKARARWDKKAQSFYTPQRSSDAQTTLAWGFKAAMKGRAPCDGSVAILAMFFRPDKRRIDADNLMKLVMDAGTQAKVWRDDCQVVAQAALIELDAAHPRTLVAICPYQGSLRRVSTKGSTRQRRLAI